MIRRYHVNLIYLKRMAALFALLFLTARLDAWGGEGHQVVALIAEERLSDQAKTSIRELLGEDVDISDAEVVNWADQIRRERRRTSPWHYVNIPVGADTFDAHRDGNGGDNIIDRIDAFEKLLADLTQPQEARVEALKFVIHFVGDVHQPLHCAERNGDRGGNTCLVWMPTAKGKATNLHAVWDTAMLRTYIGKTRIFDFADGLNQRITPEQDDAWSEGSTESWANESHRVAVAHAYAEVPEGEATRLTESYVDGNRPVIEEQLQRGGVRLAAVLNRAFATPTATQPSR